MTAHQSRADVLRKVLVKAAGIAIQPYERLVRVPHFAKAIMGNGRMLTVNNNTLVLSKTVTALDIALM